MVGARKRNIPPNVIAHIMDEQDEILKILSEINNRFQKVSMVLTRYSLTLLEDGWFFDYSLPINSIFQEIARYEKEVLNLYMERHFEERINHIKKLTIERFPKRKEIIKKAINAHKKGNYEVSIPVLIGQADGIFREITNKEFYSRRNDVKAERIIEEIKTDRFKEFNLWVLEPLKKTQLLSANFEESKNISGFLHRNPILHGEDTNYASKRNGARSLSLLNYVVKIVYDMYLSKDMTEFKNFVIKNSD